MFGEPRADRFQRTVKQEIVIMLIEVQEENLELSWYDDDYITSDWGYANDPYSFMDSFRVGNNSDYSGFRDREIYGTYELDLY